MTPAEAYQTYLVPAVFEPWALRVLDHAWPLPGQHALDVACGTGVAARELAELVGRGGRVCGVDLDAAMLDVARDTSLTRSDAAAIEWHRASVDRMPFPDGEFDFVTCLEGLQFFPHRVRALREIRRVTRRGGRFVGSVWGPLDHNPGYAALAEGLRTLLGEDAGRLPVHAIGSLGQLADLFAEAGWRADIELDTLSFSVPSAKAFVEWVASGTSTTRQRLAQLDDADRGTLDELVTRRLTRYAQPDRTLSIPSARYIIVAH